jgi:hypothetical protein
MVFSEFIYGKKINETICDELINFYENVPNKQPGKVGGINNYVDPEYKDSVDINVSPKDAHPLIQTYLSELSVVVAEYKHQYAWADKNHGKWSIVENFNIQRYLPNQGFKVWHFEKTSAEPSIRRHLVFMTYLNDVTDAGETEWFYQRIKIKPEKGLTIVWPAEWTFTHRGVVSPTQTKYIATGWYSFEKLEEEK